jgi:hypothetical protein
MTSFAPAPSAKSGPPSETSIGWLPLPIAIWPTAFLSLTSNVIDTGPRATNRFRRRRLPFSIVAVSVAPPMAWSRAPGTSRPPRRLPP